MSTAIGRKAEETAAVYLESRDFTVLDRNWRTRYCEIDIVARRRNTVYFAEVKYRSKTNYGHGLDYINSNKLRQMQFAAEIWIHNQSWTGNYQLIAVELTGQPPQVTNLVEAL